jgi:hypothetical protein
VIASLLVGCKKEDMKISVENPQSVTIKSGRLVFNDVGSFEKLLSDTKNRGKVAVLDELKSMLDTKGQMEFAKNQFVGFDSRTNAKPFLKSARIVAGDHINDLDLDCPDLIPDTEFAALVNQDGEVQVGESIYKVTTFGTFVIAEGSLDELNTLLDAQSVVNSDITQNIPDNPLFSNPVSDNLYKVSDNIYLVDTYKRASAVEAFEYAYVNTDDSFDPGTETGGGTTSGPVVVVNTEPDYNNLAEVNFHAKTWVGKRIEDLFGRNVTSGRYFSSDRRVKTTFYNLNFGVYFTVGCSVKMQKKNWIGWSSTQCQELRLGWDYIKINYKFPSAIPINTTTNNNTIGSYGYKFPQISLMNTGLSFNTLDFSMLSFLGDKSLNLDSFIDGAITKGYRDVPKYMYSLIKNKFNLPEPSTQTGLQKYAIDYTPDAFTKEICFGRNERILLNGEEINQNFDRGGFAKLTFNGGSIWSDVFTSGLNSVFNQGISVTISKGAIYGVAKFDNKWMGSRIKVD